MLYADTVDAEVGMEVSVQQDFTSELNDNTSEAYMDFSKTFRNQVRRKGTQGSSPGTELGLLGALRSGGSNISPGILGISDAEDLPKCAGVQGCGDSVLKVGDILGAVEVVLGGGRGFKERLEKFLLLESSDFIKGVEGVCKGSIPCNQFLGSFLCKKDATRF